MHKPLPVVKDLVLVGGGHAHVQVIKAFGMRPVHGLRLTIISREPATPYSGMLPGQVPGDYSEAEVHIELLKLARFAGARLLIGAVDRINPDQQTVQFGDRTVRYDLLSINTGAAPNCPFDLPHIVPVKPIGRFLPGWRRLATNLAAGQRLVVVGGGAGGFEIALAARRRLAADRAVALVTGNELLPGFPAKAQDLARQALAQYQVELHEGFRVATATPEQLTGVDGVTLDAAGVLWVTGVGAPAWLDNCGLERDTDGFIAVDDCLLSLSFANIFAAGDVAGLGAQARPKSGVFAVRQGPVLAANLRALALDANAQLRPYKAQPRFLSLLNCVDGTAIATYGSLVSRGTLWWRLKDWIDRRFMARFQVLPEMNPAGNVVADELRDLNLSDDMRCGGCGSKLNATLLDRVLRELPAQQGAHVLRGIGDDAAVLSAPSSTQVLTTDGFRAMVDDPYRFGRIGVQHALGDIYAMAAQPTAALLNVTIPLMSEAMMEDELRQVMLGVTQALAEAGVPLVGGHSAEGAELSLALTLMGELPRAHPAGLLKTSGEVGDAIVLTKPLGTGAILASAMRGICTGEDYISCVAAMDASNQRAMEILLAHNVHAATDVTGFGLLGHLLEMVPDQRLAAHLSLGQIPLLPGAQAAARAGLLSSLHEANQRVLRWVAASDSALLSPRWPLLVDPQTAGGLLAMLPAEDAQVCVSALRSAGYPGAVIIGRVSVGADAREGLPISIE